MKKSTEIPTEKQCNKCGHIKPLDAFWAHSCGRFGRMAKCIQCAKHTTVDGAKVQKKAEDDALFARGLKKCSKCGETKPIDEFWAAREGRHGLNAKCKTCGKKDGPKFYRLKRTRAEDDAFAAQGLKKCRNCSQVTPLADFPNSARTKDGKKPTCRICTNAAAVARRKAPLPKRPELLARIAELEARLRAAGLSAN